VMLSSLSIAVASFAPAPVPVQAAAAPRAAQVRMESLAELKELATKLNPAGGYWDPIGLAEAEFWDNTNEETIGWLRHAEIKHGRIAMAGFVGFCVQSQGIRIPWEPFTSITSASPPEQWDAFSDTAKWQIILGIGFLEWWSELRLEPGAKHYMKGGTPGYVPPFDATPDQLPHWIGLNLWDPFKFTKNLTPAQKEEKLLAEVNNGRLAMIGLMGVLSSAKIPESVPLLKGLIPSYAGEVMAPLTYSGPSFAEVHQNLFTLP